MVRWYCRIGDQSVTLYPDTVIIIMIALYTVAAVCKGQQMMTRGRPSSLLVGWPVTQRASQFTTLADSVPLLTPVPLPASSSVRRSQIPRFAFEKFPGTEPTLTTQMKSVGEAMAIGRTFQESFQKAMRSLETGHTGWGCEVVSADGVAARR